MYGPIYIYFIWLGIKARSFFFFNAANPNITNGGFLMESKYEIYQQMPVAFYPQTVFIPLHTPFENILQCMREAALSFPLIAKPDIGGRGRGVAVIHTEYELQDYAATIKENWMLQRFSLHKEEAGIFYYRFPGEENGNISGIVSKDFLSITGDGISAIEQLLSQNKRYVLQLPVLKKMYGDELKYILPAGETKTLVPFGNHARGSKFIDASYQADARLIETIDHICKQIPQFYFGRMDIKFNNWEELRNGKNFDIIELNGAGSEPTHIYDPQHSIFFAWKEIIRHWKLLYRISILNHKLYKIPFMTWKEGRAMFRANTEHLKKVGEK